MRLRFGLFPKYATALLLLVGIILLVNGALELAFTYRESRQSAAIVQRSEARVAAARIEQVLGNVQSHLLEVGGLPWESGLLKTQDRREEYQRLLKLVPAIAELRHFDHDGMERLKVSRLEVDEVDAGRTVEAEEHFRAALEKGVAFSRTYFKAGSEPYVTLAVRDRAPAGGVTMAELNLKFVAEVVTQIRIGENGRAYVVDSANHVIAHPDLNVVLRRTDLSGYAPIRELRTSVGDASGMIEAEGMDGAPVLASGTSIPAADWLVIAEQPKNEALRPVYRALLITAVLVGGGLLAAIFFSYVLARRLSGPILRLREGAEKIARGDLSTRITVRTGDEVEALANEFNIMADQLQDYTTGLERKVNEKTVELETANRHKSEFLANMSHELRTPLNAVIGFSDVLQERMFGELNDKQMEYARDIHSSGQHLLSLINDILDLSKIEAGRMELDPRAFDVGAALDNCRTLIRERARGRGLRLTFGVPESLGTWIADERKFKQIVVNLLSNAVKFTPPGGEVRLGARMDPDALVISVSDTGPGIAPEDHAVIFEEFRQLKPSGNAKHEGTGLGLALAQRLARLHGGSMRVESAKGKGATFTVRFPRLPSAPGNG